MRWRRALARAALSYFQRSYRKRHTQDRDDPKPGHDLALMVSQLLIMVMQGTHKKHPFSVAIFLFRIPEIADLYDDAETLDQENAAENRDQPFLTNDNGQCGDDTPQCQATRIAHEHLRGIGIVPEEAYAGPDERPDKDGQLAQIGDVHDVEVFRETDIAACIGKNTQAGAHDRAGPRGKPIQAVGQVGPIGDCRDDEDHDHDIEHPGQPPDRRGQQLRIVELMILDEGNGRDRLLRLHKEFFFFVECNDLETRSIGRQGLTDIFAPYAGIAVEIERATNHDTQYDLAEDLEPTGETVLIAFFIRNALFPGDTFGAEFRMLVDEADDARWGCAGLHKLDMDLVVIGHGDGGGEDCQFYVEAAH